MHRLTRGFEPSGFVINKARRYIAEGRVRRDPESSGIWWVQGSDSREYRVQTDAHYDAERDKDVATYVTCTCPFGMKQGDAQHACAHAVAGLLYYRIEQEQARQPSKSRRRGRKHHVDTP